jgi:hypothetical protein
MVTKKTHNFKIPEEKTPHTSTYVLRADEEGMQGGENK